jgi:succinate-semialdehyde dehydrogenase/glutarate-semialdehyde dehydrogenase
MAKNTLPILTNVDQKVCFINGRWTPAKNSFAVKNPATGETLAEVADCGEDEMRYAVESAAHAFSAWSRLSAWERGAILRRFAERMTAHREDLARLMTLEQGKPLSESQREIDYAASFIDWFAEEGKRVYGETIPASAPGKRLFVIRQPIGVCAAITPWNFPQAMITRKLGPALAAGCTFIVKPAPETPLSALALAACANEAGMPPGVLNVVTGDAERIAGVLMKSDTVRLMSFTGSTEVGRILLRQSAETLKRVTLELGGNAPFIVFEDADLAAACRGAMFGKYRNAGQTCICVNRFIVHERVREAFTAMLAEASSKLRVGNGLAPETEIGPLISREALEKVSRLLRGALDRGAHLRLGAPPDGKSLFVPPIVIDNVDPLSDIWQQEIFGPVCAVASFRDDDEAVRLANATEYGLAGYFYTKDLSRAMRVAEALQCGIVGINETAVSTAQAPFGGVKHSGFGREGGHQGIEEYLDTKFICVGTGS